MRVLFIGDVVGEPGCDLVRKVLPGFKRMQGVDFCIINGENSAKGNGVTPQSCEHLLTSGADALTGGNHSLRRPEIYRVLEEESGVLLRPFNLHRSAPGKGLCVLEKRGLRLGVANLMGRIDMDDCENPFDSADAIVREFETAGVKCALVDFHAEATSEKRAMGFYLDGRVSAVFGTHTHVATADEQILPGGTAYITDAGMTGVIRSVLGITIESATEKMRTGLPVRFQQAEGPASLSCVLTEIDNATGRATSIERFLLS